MADKGTDPISSGKPIGPMEKPIAPGQPPAGFESYMQGTAGQPKPAPGESAPSSGPTPMEIARGAAGPSAELSLGGLSAQTKAVQDTLGQVHRQLNDKNLKLKRSQSHLIRQKLGGANDHIRSAASKLGMAPSQQSLPPGLSGISRFIAMVNDGQDQLAQVQEKLKQMSAQGGNINPADMLSVQVKMGLAQQEISYASTLLGKVIQSITQIINTQL